MYYIAIVAPRSINEEVLRWKHFMRDHFGCQVALRSPAHITLVPPFWVNTSHQPDLEDAIEKFSSSRKGFLVQLHNFDAFKPKVIFLHVEPSEQLNALRADLENFLLSYTMFDFEPGNRDFHPHITIANRDLHKRDFFVAWDHFKNKTYRASFETDGITMMKHNGTQWDAEYKAIFPSKR